MNLLKLTAEITMSSREIAELTGKDHFNVLIDIRKMLDEAIDLKNQVNETTYKDSIGRTLPAYDLSYHATMVLVTGYSVVLRAAVLKRWQDLEHQQAKPNYSQPHMLPAQSVEAIQFATLIAEHLKLPQSGFLDIAKRALTIKAPELVPALPHYGIDTSPVGLVTTGSSKPTFSATTLLKRHNLPYSAVGFNRLLVSAGVLIDMTRPSTTKGTKSYKAISPDWLHYGKNVISPTNPRETQPHWYDDTFAELVDKITK